MIAQIFNPAAELVNPTEIATDEVNEEIETQPVVFED